MSLQYNADEIFAMAEEIERNGAKFYRKAAEFINNGEARVLMLKLADMEDDHEKRFAAMRSKLVELKQDDLLTDADDMAGLYLAAIADGYVFDVKTSPADRLNGDESLEEVLRMAIGLERDSIAFYVGLKQKVPAHLGQDAIDHIIGEEIAHVAILSKEVANLQNA